MVFTKMAMKNLEATKELVNMVNLAARAWKVDPFRTENDKHFDEYCEREHGLKVEFSIAGNAVMVDGATIIDEDKYSIFLLKFGNMPNE